MPRLGALVLAASLAASVSLAPRLSFAGEPTMKPEARAHLDQGLAAYGEKDWARAIDEFSAGYAIDPRPEFLFAWAQAERLSGDCATAIDLYEKFVDTGPSPEQESAARQMTDRCRETLAESRPVPPREPPPAKKVPAQPPAPPPAPGSERAWWKDGWGATLAGAGVVGLGVGVGMYVAAGSSEDAADRAANYDEFAHFKEEAATRRSFAAVGLGVGAALLVGAGVRYYLVGSRHEATGVAVSFAPGGGASLWVGGSF